MPGPRWWLLLILVSLAPSSCSSDDPAACVKACTKASQDLVQNYGAQGPDPLQCNTDQWQLSCQACDRLLGERLSASYHVQLTDSTSPCESNR